MKKILISISSLFLLFALVSCSAQPTKLLFEKSNYTLHIGESVTLSPVFEFESTNNQEKENIDVTYASEDNNVATVTKDGVVTATGVGTTEIRAAVNDLVTTIQIIVQ